MCTSKSLHTHHDSFAVIVDTDSIVRVGAAAVNAQAQRRNERVVTLQRPTNVYTLGNTRPCVPEIVCQNLAHHTRRPMRQTFSDPRHAHTHCTTTNSQTRTNKQTNKKNNCPARHCIATLHKHSHTCANTITTYRQHAVMERRPEDAIESIMTTMAE